ncbi:MAG: hypothetical protein CME70_04255 [Halobacteriovorax sp.]|nr:hypothetical protein [Halobacteriovorax sp.]|tara:strand:- start:57994 stop:58521 length:528 start_codon:yes stop_codon:yes gene_type:complete
MKFLIFIAILASFNLKAEVKDIHLSLISTNYVDKTYSLYVGVDKKNEIQYIKTINNKKNKQKIYPNNVLKNNVPLVKAAGIELVTLRCENFDPNIGCPITIKYPINVIVMAFKSFKAEIKKVDNKWGLYIGPKKFTKMHLIARKTLGLLIGVKRIEVSQLSENSSSYSLAINSQE